MYHVYAKKINNNIRLYGQFEGNKAEVNRLISYWNLFYSDRYIKPVK